MLTLHFLRGPTQGMNLSKEFHMQCMASFTGRWQPYAPYSLSREAIKNINKERSGGLDRTGKHSRVVVPSFHVG